MRSLRRFGVAVVAGLVFVDVNARAINSTYITIASQMQYHTQRLAKAAGIAARGQATAFPQVQDSRDEFAAFRVHRQIDGLQENRNRLRRGLDHAAVFNRERQRAFATEDFLGQFKPRGAKP